MRETIASMVLSEMGLDLSGTSVLDAFAGSGAVGLELLSRGAAHVTLVERDRRAAGVVRENVRALGVPKGQATVVAADAFALAARDAVDGAPFGLVFLDPPYATETVRLKALVEALAEGGMVEDGCLVVLERASDGAGLGLAEGLGHEVRVRRHGTTAVELWRLSV